MLGYLLRRNRRSSSRKIERGLSRYGQSVEHACHLAGWYDISGDRITGWVEDVLDPSNRALSIIVARDSIILAYGTVAEKAWPVGWRFDTDALSGVTPHDLLFDRVRVLVHDTYGNFQTLRLEGATQLALIEEAIIDPTPPLLEIDFGANGNSAAFIGDGWSGQEMSHRWTDGARSALVLPPLFESKNWEIQLRLWPHTEVGRLDDQRLTVLVNETQVSTFSVACQSFLRCRVRASDYPHRLPVSITFLHPDAASPFSLGVSNDTRMLAFAFKKVRLMPLTSSERF
jgi:hypothetical protein